MGKRNCKYTLETFISLYFDTEKAEATKVQKVIYMQSKPSRALCGWHSSKNLLLPGLVVSDPLDSSWLDLLHELRAEHTAASFLFVLLHAMV